MSNMENRSIEQLNQEAVLLLEKAAEVANVTSPESEARASEFVAQAKLRFDLVEQKRKFIVQPFNQQIRTINAEFKKTTSPLEEAIELVRDGMKAYRASDTFRLLEAKREAMQGLVVTAVQEGNLEDLEHLSGLYDQVNADAPKSIATKTGRTYYRTDTKWKVQNLDLIPANFLMPDEDAIDEAIKQGLSIPGIYVWEEKTPITRN